MKSFNKFFLLFSLIVLFPVLTLLADSTTFIAVESVEGGAVSIDGILEGIILNGKVVLMVEEGVHEIMVTKDGFAPMVEEVTIRQGELLTIQMMDYLDSIIAIDSGGNHLLVLKGDGTLWGVGLNTSHQLGLKEKGFITQPEKLDDHVIAMSAGKFHTLLLHESGELKVVGNNEYGQLGTGNKWNNQNFSTVADEVISVVAGPLHSLFIKKDNSLWAVGYNEYGQLGLGDTTHRFTPEKVMNDVASVAAGSDHTMILKRDGSLWATGRNDMGQLGTKDTRDYTRPIKVADQVKEVFAGTMHTLFLKDDGTLWGCGASFYGQLGTGEYDHKTYSKPIKIMDQVKTVATGYSHSLVLTNDAKLWVMGENTYGQLGVGDFKNRYKPEKILEDVSLIAAGGRNSIILKNDGTIHTTLSNYVFYQCFLNISSGNDYSSSRDVQQTKESDSSDEICLYEVGDIGPAGGYICFVDESNSFTWNYLEVAPAGWYHGGEGKSPWGIRKEIVVPSSSHTAIGGGDKNTSNTVYFHENLYNWYPEKGLLSQNPKNYGLLGGIIAAKLCADYTMEYKGIVYDDWFLPSKDELQLIYTNLHKNKMGGFENSYYWSSSEKDEFSAWYQSFSNGKQDFLPRDKFLDVRPIRAF